MSEHEPKLSAQFNIRLNEYDIALLNSIAEAFARSGSNTLSEKSNLLRFAMRMGFAAMRFPPDVQKTLLDRVRAECETDVYSTKSFDA